MPLALTSSYQKGADTYDFSLYTGDVSFPGTFNMTIDGFNIDWISTEEDTFSPLLTSTLTINFVFEQSIAQIAFFALIDADNSENEFVCVVEKNGSRWWVGTLMPETIVYQDTKPPYPIQLRFTDGLKKLKDIDYNNGGSGYTGTATLAAHIFNCLDEIGITSYHSTGNFIVDNTNWVEDDMQTHVGTYATVTRLLDYTRVQHRLFREQDRKGKITYKSCYDVLKHIMEAFGLRLMYSGGAFRVDQYSKLIEDAIDYYVYDNTGTINTTIQTDAAFFKSIDTDNQRVVSGGGTYTYLPALKKSTVYYDHFSTRNLIEGDVWDETSTARTYDEFDTNGGTAKILSGWNVQYNVNFGGTDTYHFVLWRVRIKVGSQYFRRTATVGTNALVTYGNPTWSASNSYYYIAADWTTADNLNRVFQFAFETPVPPANGTLEVDFDVEAVYDIDGNIISGLSYTLTFDAEGYVEALINGVIKDQSDQRSYVSLTGANNTKHREVSVILGDGPTANSFGHCQIYNGSAWEVSDAWRVGDSGTYTELGALLANEITAISVTPSRIMNGTISGDYEAHLPLKRGTGYRFIPLRLRFTALNDLWEGSWYDIDPLSNYTEQTPQEGIVRTRPIAPSILNNPSGLPAPQPQIKGKDQILNRLIPAQVGSTGITSGATVTSIPLKSAATGDDFIKNDVIVLVNLNTGEEQEFTVSANVVATNTSISVSSVTATADFPADSFIIQKTQQAKEQLNTSLAKRLPLEDYQVDANYTNKLTITNMDEFSIQVRDDATSPTAVTTLTMNMSSTVLVYQKGGNNVYLDLDDVTGARMYYDNGSSVTTVQVKDGIINLEGVPNYADNTAADAALSSGDIYTLTGDRTLYKKP